MGWLNENAQAIQAVAAVLSFVALIVVVIATVWYAKRTADIAQASRESANQQARVAELMEKDLRFRVAPFLKYMPLGGLAREPKGAINNEGRGTALDLKALFRFIPQGRQKVIETPRLLEASQQVPANLVRQQNEDKYVIEISCTDSAKLNHYWFQWNNDGSYADHKIEPRDEAGES